MTIGVVKGPRIVEGPYRRQKFLLGYLKQGVSLEQAQAHLIQHGFFPHRVAFIDPGQGFSMRRLCDDYPDRQYHIRVFDNGEVRGHYEYTPEDRPWKHLERAVFEDRRGYFSVWLRDICRVVDDPRYPR